MNSKLGIIYFAEMLNVTKKIALLDPLSPSVEGAMFLPLVFKQYISW